MVSDLVIRYLTDNFPDDQVEERFNKIVYRRVLHGKPDRCYAYCGNGDGGKNGDANFAPLGFVLPPCVDMTIAAAFLYNGISLEYIANWFKEDEDVLKLFHVHQSGQYRNNDTGKCVRMNSNIDLPFFWAMAVHDNRCIATVDMQNIIFLMRRLQMVRAGLGGFHNLQLFNIYQKKVNKNGQKSIQVRNAPIDTMGLE